MSKIFIILAIIGLVLSAVSPLLTFLGLISVGLNKALMFAGMLIWFAGATPWLGGKKLRQADVEVEI